MEVIGPAYGEALEASLSLIAQLDAALAAREAGRAPSPSCLLPGRAASCPDRRSSGSRVIP